LEVALLDGVEAANELVYLYIFDAWDVFNFFLGHHLRNDNALLLFCELQTLFLHLSLVSWSDACFPVLMNVMQTSAKFSG